MRQVRVEDLGRCGEKGGKRPGVGQGVARRGSTTLERFGEEGVRQWSRSQRWMDGWCGFFTVAGGGQDDGNAPRSHGWRLKLTIPGCRAAANADADACCCAAANADADACCCAAATACCCRLLRRPHMLLMLALMLMLQRLRLQTLLVH